MDAAKQTSNGLTRQGSILIQRQVVRYRNEEDDKGKSQNHLSKKDLFNAGMTDKYIRHAAKEKASEQFENSPKRKLEDAAIYLGIPAVYSLARGALNTVEPIKETLKIDTKNLAVNYEGKFKPAIVQNKIKTSLGTAKQVGLGIAGVLGAFKLADVITDKVPAMKEFKEDHPAATLLGTIAGAIGVGLSANNVFDAAKKKISAVNINGKEIGARVKAGANSVVNKLGLNSPKFLKGLDNKIYKPMAKALTTKPGIFVREFATPLVIGGILVNHFANIAGLKKNYKNIKREMEQDRLISQAKVALNQPKPHVVRETKHIILMPSEKQA